MSVMVLIEAHFDEDEEREVPALTCPSQMVVCGRCAGSGVTTAICEDGMDPEMWDEMNGDEREEYIDGVYDKPCPDCKGLRVVPEPRLDALTAEDRKRFDKYESDLNDDAVEAAYEARVLRSGGQV